MTDLEGDLPPVRQCVRQSEVGGEAVVCENSGEPQTRQTPLGSHRSAAPWPASGWAAVRPLAGEPPDKRPDVAAGRLTELTPDGSSRADRRVHVDVVARGVGEDRGRECGVRERALGNDAML